MKRLRVVVGAGAISFALIGVCASPAGAVWSGPIDLTPGGDTTVNPLQGPGVGIAADGDAVFVWRRFDGTHQRIQARTRSAAGVLGPILRLSENGQDAGFPQVDVNPNGDAAFTWLRSNGAVDIAQARTLSAAGVLSPVQNLSRDPGTSFAPQVAIDDEGDATFTWCRFNSPNFQIQTRTRSAAGPMTAVQNLSAAGKNSFQPQVAVDDDGDAVFAWRRDEAPQHSIAQARARSAAGTLSPIDTLSAPAENAQEPQVGVDDVGNAVFAWGDGVGHVDVRARSAAGVLSATRQVSTPGKVATTSRIGVDDQGGAVISFTQFGGEVNRIQAAKRTAAGTISGPQALSASGQNADISDVAVEADGDAVVIWRRQDETGFYVAQARTRTASGTLGPVAGLSVPGKHAFAPQVAVNDLGTAVGTWIRNDGSDTSTDCCYRIQASVGP